jgi:putative thioredoxin
MSGDYNSYNPYGGSMGGQMHVSTGNAASPAGAANGAGKAAAGLIKDTTTASFPRDVIEESRHQPVLVDFWAPWCGPCRQLGPMIEKVVTEAKGRVKLVKMNIDEHPEYAGQMGIQSIPAVVAFVNGQPADGFMGAVPESQIRQFIDKIAGPGGADDGEAEIAAALEQAVALLAEKDASGAASLFAAVLQADPDNLQALAGMANCMILAKQHERALGLLAPLSDEQKADPAIAAVLKSLEQYEEARKLGDPAALEHELSLNPDHHESRIKLAKIMNVQGNREDAADHLLYIMKKDRTFDDDGARRELLGFFEAWGPKDPATSYARRKMSSILFS